MAYARAAGGGQIARSVAVAKYVSTAGFLSLSLSLSFSLCACACFHKVGSGSTFPNIVVETQIYAAEYKMLLQLVVLAPKQARFASGGGFVATDSSSTLQDAYAYEQHHAPFGF